MDILPDPVWQRLPLGLRLRLAAASGGKDHAFSCGLGLAAAAGAEPAAARELLHLALCQFILALEADPLSGALAGLVADLSGKLGALKEKELATLAPVARAWREPPDVARYRELAAAGDPEVVADWLETAGKQDPGNIFFLQQKLQLAMSRGRWVEAIGLLDAPGLAALPALRARLAGDAQFLRGDFPAAEKEYRSALALFPFLQAPLRLAEALRRQDRAGEGLDRLAGFVRAHPWHVQAQLRLNALRAGFDAACAPPPGRTLATVYTWNKARDLGRCLAALAGSDPRPTSVLVLDNGSTDETPHIIAEAAHRFPAGVFRSLRLPVNIGAPAARNWLLAEPEARAADFVAYLDDDALVAPDWLGRLGAAVAARPGAGVWGAKIAEAAAPWRLQCADLHLVPAAPDNDLPFDLPAPFLQEFDCGQYDYLRSCASVTGCCHLFRREVLAGVGGFDIRFSPSQYDDLDHDLCLCLAGRMPVYTGFTAARHVKSTGLAAVTPGGDYASGRGNRLKLAWKYAPEELARIMENDLAAMLAETES